MAELFRDGHLKTFSAMYVRFIVQDDVQQRAVNFQSVVVVN